MTADPELLELLRAEREPKAEAAEHLGFTAEEAACWLEGFDAALRILGVEL